MEDTPGDRLRTARLSAGLTQEQLAVRMGICQSRVAAVEGGRPKDRPSLSWLLKAAQALGADPAVLHPALAGWDAEAQITWDARRRRWLLRLGKQVLSAPDSEVGDLLRRAQGRAIQVVKPPRKPTET